MPSSDPGLLDGVSRTLFGLETRLGLLRCDTVLGYLTYEALLSSTAGPVAVAGGSIVSVVSAAVLVGLGRRLSL